MKYIKPANEDDRPKFLYFLATSGSAIGVSGDGIFTVPDAAMKILDQQNLHYIPVQQPQKNSNQ